MGSVIIPYRGDLVTARLSVKAKKKKYLRKFKREILSMWDLTGRLSLWHKETGYLNDSMREFLGFEKNFMDEAEGITGFGVELTPAADVEKVLALDDTQKDYLRAKCLAIFSKYGRRVKTSYKDGGYDFQTFKKVIEEVEVIKIVDGVEEISYIEKVTYEETEYDDEEDAQLAEILYDRIVMYMINNDSTDTTDEWASIHNSANFFDDDIRSNLKSYTTDFSTEDLVKIIEDRLFTKRSYKTSTNGVTAIGIDMHLFNELLDDGLADTVNGNYWIWNGGVFSINAEAVRALPEDEFLVFIQTHLATWYNKKEKKWFQKGIWGVIFAVIIVVIAILLRQPGLLLVAFPLGTVLVVAGMLISMVGALIGNEVMITAGQIVSLVGGGMNFADSIMQSQLTIEAAKQLAINVGADNLAVQAIVSGVIDDMVLDMALTAGKFALSTYSSVSSMIGEKETLDLKESVTPREKINEIYVADDMSWDFVQQYLPDFIIANSLRIM